MILLNILSTEVQDVVTLVHPDVWNLKLLMKEASEGKCDCQNEFFEKMEVLAILTEIIPFLLV